MVLIKEEIMQKRKTKKNQGFLRLVLLSILFTFLAAGVSAAPVKIMPLGDSITGTPGCWRSILWNRLQDTGYTDIDFVGTQMGQICSLPFDDDCEGHGSILAVDIANQNQLPPWLAATSPDIVMMHLGSNDVMVGPKTNTQILAAYSKMIDQMRVNNPNMKILVAQIIPMYSPTSGCSTCYQQVIDLNAAIPAWAAGKTTSRSPIIVVDQWTGFNTATDTSEGLHPNDAGNQKISDKWYPPLTALLSGTTPTAAPTTPGDPIGDVNGNGSIDIVDALLIAQYYVGLEPSPFIQGVADVNCSGDIDIIDALLVAQFYVGLITAFC
ncbi:MAG: hypothetical protein JXJ04_07550 [Spirochaetales bacterium]|nr:hypothetical protein [Spirochaetales bacterium]